MSTETANQDQEKASEKSDLRQRIIAHYQEHLLLNGEPPASVYAFCKELEIKESEFYQYFASFTQISAAFWSSLFEENIERLENSPEYTEFTVREKLLSFYYSFFEALKDHRSYALKTLNTQMFSIKREIGEMDQLKKKFKIWIKTLMAEGRQRDEVADRSRLSDQYDSMFWYQFLFLLDFWRKDGSTGFERTDEAIEKTVNLSFDLIEKNALDSAFDFGKFIFQNFR